MRDIQIFRTIFWSQLDLFSWGTSADLFSHRGSFPFQNCISLWALLQDRVHKCYGRILGGLLRVLILEAGQEMCQLWHSIAEDWGVSLSNKFILDTICPQMWKYACSVEVIDESSSGRSGDASSEFVPSPTFTFTCAQCRANYCN